jgi:hypothetical protein
MNPRTIEYLANDRIAGMVAEAAPSRRRSTEQSREARTRSASHRHHFAVRQHLSNFLIR